MKDFCIWVQLLFKNYATYKLFRLNVYGVPKLGMESQGIDVFDNRYIFQGSDQGGKLASLVVIDMQEKKIIAEFDLGLPKCHMNNINIGKKLKPESKFPLLYISECKNKERCFVVDLKNDLSGFSVIQTISFKSDNFYAKTKYPFDWFISDKYIYTFGMTKTDGEIEVIKFLLPDIEKQNIEYTDKDIISSFKLQDCHTYQGTKIVNRKLYALFGLDTKECPMYLKIINLETGKIEKSINIKGLDELEGLGIYEDGIIVSKCAINPVYTFIKIK